jgi:hypothetical protein
VSQRTHLGGITLPLLCLMRKSGSVYSPCNDCLFCLVGGFRLKLVADSMMLGESPEKSDWRKAFAGGLAQSLSNPGNKSGVLRNKPSHRRPLHSLFVHGKVSETAAASNESLPVVWFLSLPVFCSISSSIPIFSDPVAIRQRLWGFALWFACLPVMIEDIQKSLALVVRGSCMLLASHRSESLESSSAGLMG